MMVDEGQLETRARYRRVTDGVVTSLAGIVGSRNVLTGDGLENHSRDDMPRAKSFLPEVVVKPEDSG